MVWSLHRDLGFPLDLVDLMLEERGVQVDRQELDRLIAEKHKVKFHSDVCEQGNISVLSGPVGYSPMGSLAPIMHLVLQSSTSCLCLLGSI